MKQLIFTFIFIFSFTIAFAQNNSSNDRAFQKGLIIYNDSTYIQAEDVLIKNDSVQYYTTNSSILHTQSLNTINEIQKYDGNYAVTGEWLGGIAGAGIGVLIALGTKKTETTKSGYPLQIVETKTTIQTWPIAVLCGVGWAIGYFIGQSTPSYKTVYSKSMAFINKMNLRINYGLRGVSLSYRIKF